MKTIRILIQALFLASLNLGAIIFGFAIYHVTKVPHQSIVQIPVAIVVSVYGFLLWLRILRLLHFERLLPEGTKELSFIYIACLLWAPTIFIPLHYVTQGYLTSFGNIYGIWMFQIPTNLLALAMANRLFLSRLKNVDAGKFQELKHG